MKIKIIYQLMLLLLPGFAFAQTESPIKPSITGVWKGEFYVDSTKKTYPFEITISEDKGKYTGYSRIAFEEDGVKQVVFRDHKIKVNDNTVIIEDDNQLSKASSVSQPKEVKKTMTLTLTTTDSSMQLSGPWSTNKTKHFLQATGTAQIQRKADFRSTEIFKKLEELSLTNKLSFTKDSPEELVQKLDKVLLPAIAKIESTPKIVKVPNTVVKPKPYSRSKEIAFTIAKKESQPVEKAIAEPVVVVKKAAPAPTPKPIAAAKPAPITKTEKPVPSTVVAVAPAPIVAAVKKSSPLPIQVNAALDVSKRTISNEQSLYYKSDSLQITLYDNGEIDGDTVSVLLNGKVIIAKKGLDTKPNSYTIYFDRDSPDSQMLVMYAENLGSIPPNTGLLVVREGASVYEVRFSADLKTNAAIILRRKRD